jgi:hypothetical protein
MSEVSIGIKAELIPLTGKGSQILNKFLKEKVLPIVVKAVTVDIADRAEQYARGIKLPIQGRLLIQANHLVGQSKSGYISTGKLADSIQVSPIGRYASIIVAMEYYASYVEFGTFGGTSPGQAPQPFMRSSIWFISENMANTISKIQSELRNIR